MSATTKPATLFFLDEGSQDNRIMSLVILHTTTEIKQGVYPFENAPAFTLYKWTKIDHMDFKEKAGDYWHTGVTIDKDLHDVWAVAFQRRKNKYVEYLQQAPGFWKKLEEEVVKEVCNTAIEVFGVFDDETTTPLLEVATDKAIHEIYTKGDGDVKIKNWVHWDSPSIQINIGETSGRIYSPHHSTNCNTERFGAQDVKQ